MQTHKQKLLTTLVTLLDCGQLGGSIQVEFRPELEDEKEEPKPKPKLEHLSDPGTKATLNFRDGVSTCLQGPLET